MKPLELIDILEHMRPSGDQYTLEWGQKYLAPIMGEPDAHGNYTLIIGDKPNVAFMSHYDTVHRMGGLQDVLLDDEGYLYAPNSSCLGADCGTGVWLCLELIRAGVEGVYVIHADEEIGCVGSTALVKDNPSWLEHVDFAISFDRFGYDSVITHQMGQKSASGDFASSFGDAVDMGEDHVWQPDSGGVFTDSAEYVSVVSECTNISVGYFNQHTSKETQDYGFAYDLRDALVATDWSQLVAKRDPSLTEWDERWERLMGERQETGGIHWSTAWSDIATDDDNKDPEYETMADMVHAHPEEVAKMLRAYGFTTYDLAEEIGLSSYPAGCAA